MKPTVARLISAAFLLIRAARVDDLIARYPKFEEDIRKLNDADPSTTKKYLLWGTVQLHGGEPIEKIIEAFNKFHTNYQRLAKKDINKYDSTDEVIAAVEALGASREQQRAVKRKDAHYLYNDDNFLLVHPTSMEASCHYGMGTKWCISATQSTNYFDSYAEDNKFFYFIINKKSEDPKWHKVAMMLDKDAPNSPPEFWAADDQPTSAMNFERHLSDDTDEAEELYIKFKDLATKHMHKQPSTWQSVVRLPDPAPSLKLYIDSGKSKDIAHRIFKVRAKNRLPIPVEILELYAENGTPDEKIAVAESASATPDILKKVIDTQPKDGEVYSLLGVAKSPNANADVLWHLVKKLPELATSELDQGLVLFEVAGNPKASPDLLAVLAQSRDDAIREAVAQNENSPAELTSAYLEELGAEFQKFEHEGYAGDLVDKLVRLAGNRGLAEHVAVELVSKLYGSVEKAKTSFTMDSFSYFTNKLFGPMLRSRNASSRLYHAIVTFLVDHYQRHWTNGQAMSVLFNWISDTSPPEVLKAAYEDAMSGPASTTPDVRYQRQRIAKNIAQNPDAYPIGVVKEITDQSSEFAAYAARYSKNPELLHYVAKQRAYDGKTVPHFLVDQLDKNPALPKDFWNTYSKQPDDTWSRYGSPPEAAE
jgi:hypothetical protein